MQKRDSFGTTFSFIILPAIFHMSYWDKSIPGKISGNPAMVHLAEINQVSSPYLMLQHIGGVATPNLVPRNCLRYLRTTLIVGGGELVSEFMWVIVWKNKWKMKGGLEKPEFFFSLNSLFLMFGIFQMVLWLIGSLLDHFDPQKTWSVYVKEWYIFVIKSEYSKYPIRSFLLACYHAGVPTSFMTFFYGTYY